MTAVPVRVAIARIIDPTAWTVDRDGFTVEHVHSGEALIKADAILELQSAQSEPCAVPGCDNATDRGICDDCDRWVDGEVAKLKLSQTTDMVILPRAAAQRLLDDLNGRIDAAHPTAVPVFAGIVELHDALGATPLLPASPPALKAAIAQLEDFSDNGLLLDEIENWPAFGESVMLCLHELKRLQAAALWPPLTPVLREVLGFMCFQLGGAAHVYRAAGEFVDGDGEPLKSRAEDEQAFMLHKFVGWALTHGAGWSEVASTDFKRVRAVAESRKGDA